MPLAEASRRSGAIVACSLSNAPTAIETWSCAGRLERQTAGPATTSTGFGRRSSPSSNTAGPSSPPRKAPGHTLRQLPPGKAAATQPGAEESQRCIDCHDNPHGNQFAGEMSDGGCAHCHSERGWDFAENGPQHLAADRRSFGSLSCDSCRCRRRKRIGSAGEGRRTEGRRVTALVATGTFTLGSFGSPRPSARVTPVAAPHRVVRH